MMNKLERILLFICFAGCFLRIGVAMAMGDAVDALPGIHDQISYHTLTVRVIDGYGFSFGQLWWPATRAGEPTAHWSYLYTFYLVLVYKIFGTHPLAARLIQGVIAGMLIPWLSYRLAFRIFDRIDNRTSDAAQAGLVALVAAAWAACYPYFLYYASALMTETFFILGVLWILDLSTTIADISREEGASKQWGKWLQLGLAIGVTAMLRQAILIWIPFLCLWLIWAKNISNKPARQTWQTMTGFFLSGIVASCLILPITISNYERFGRFVFLNTNAGYAFFWANHPIYGDHFIPILSADQPSYQELIPKQLLGLNEAALDQALLKEGIKFVFNDPWRYLRLSFSRIPVYFQFWPSSESSLPSNLTRVFSFGLALPFMLFGTLLWVRDAKSRVLSVVPGSLLLQFCIIYSGVHLLSWALVRYRLPVDAVMLIFAAYGLASLLKRTIIWSWLLAKVSIENPVSGSLRADSHPN
jgi:hypothetical protein